MLMEATFHYEAIMRQSWYIFERTENRGRHRQSCERYSHQIGTRFRGVPERGEH